LRYLYARWNPAPKHATFFTFNNLALPAKNIPCSRGSDASWTRAAGEDRDLCDRLIARGYRLIYAPDALVRHAHPLTLRTFWQQHINYRRGAYRVHQLRARRDARGICVEPLVFYLRMLGDQFARTRGREGAFLAAVLAIAQAANAAGWIAAFLDYLTKMSPR